MPEEGVARTPAVKDVNPDSPREVIPFTYAITSYGADFPVESLVRRLQMGDIYVPEFQRSYVWKKAQADRFIESLLLGLPVPGVFLALEDESRRLLVVDGQQRLTTLRRYYGGDWEGDDFALDAVQAKFRGSRYSQLADEDRRRLDDSIIHATIIRQEEPSEDRSSIYFVFERLNTGGTPLQPQEIRNSIYRGPLRDLLQELAHLPSWGVVFGRPSPRLKDQELILRFFALLHDRARYQQPMKVFLNRFMAHNRQLDELKEQDLRRTFSDTTDLLADALGKRAFRIRGAVNAAIFDSVMTGLAERLTQGDKPTAASVASAYERLLANPEYQSSIRKATANEEAVQTRIRLAGRAFHSVR